MILRNREYTMKKALQRNSRSRYQVGGPCFLPDALERGPTVDRWWAVVLPSLVRGKQASRPSSSTPNFPAVAILAIVERGVE